VAFLGLAVAGTGCKDDGTIRVESFKLQGVHAFDEQALKDVLATHTSSKLPWGRKEYFDRMKFDDDLNRIRTFYADRGYPDARITAFDAKLNGAQDAVALSVSVDEGDPVLVTSIQFVGFDGIPAAHFDRLKRSIPLLVQHARDRQFVSASSEMAMNELRDHGFPYATVSVTEDDGQTGKEAKIVFVAEPGAFARFGQTEIQGAESVGEGVIRRAITFKPGDIYQRSRLQETQRSLYNLSLFQFVNVEPVDNDVTPTEVPTKITVAEGNHQRVNFGAGYGTEERVRVDAEYHHVNFFGGARTAGVHARWSSLDRGVQADFTQPYVFNPHITLGVQAQQWFTVTPAYNSTVTSATVTATYRVRQRTWFSASVTSERDSSSVVPEVLADLTLRDEIIALGIDPRTGEQNGTLNAFMFDVHHSTADNVLNARRGYQVNAHFEHAGWLLPGTFRYTAMSLEGRHYLPLGNRFVLANRAQWANVAPVNGDPGNVPFSRLLFLGGSTSIRGWGRYEVSPLSEDGLPIGGNSLLAFSSELRFPIEGKLSAVTFLDAGNVTSNSWAVPLDSLRYAIGAGLRYQTPVGPIRFDYGYQLNPIPGLVVNGEPQQRRWRMHFSIGQAF
jgi:outer membrane protein insertion porin family/translocation and assembly module TamA